MKKIIIFFAVMLAAAGNVFATDVTVSSLVLDGFNPANIGSDRSITVSVTNNSAVVTSSALFPPNAVGMGGFTVSINGVQYTVAAIASTSSLTLTANYAASTGAATMIFYKWVEIRVYADRAFQPLGSSQVVQSGAPGSSAWFRRFGASVINNGSANQLFISQFILPATTDALITNQARYTLGFYRPDGSFVQFFVCPSSISQLALPPSTPTTFGAICQFNAPSAIIPPANTAYTKTEIDSRFPSCSAGQIYVFNAPGNVLSCGTGGGGGIGGANTQVQFNDSGLFSGDPSFTWVKATDVLTLGTPASSTGAARLKMTGAAYPNGMVMRMDSEESEGVNIGTFNLTIGRFNNTGDARDNEVMTLGYNNAQSGRELTTEPALHLSVESYFSPSVGTRFLEWHDPEYTTPAGVAIRVVSHTINSGTGVITSDHRASSFNFKSPADVDIFGASLANFTIFGTTPVLQLGTVTIQDVGGNKLNFEDDVDVPGDLRVGTFSVGNADSRLEIGNNGGANVCAEFNNNVGATQGIRACLETNDFNIRNIQTGAITLATGTTGGSSSIRMTVASDGLVTIANTAQIGTASTTTGTIALKNSANTNTLTLSPGTTTTSYTLTFPAAAPGSTQCLQMSNTGAVTTTGSACGAGGGGGYATIQEEGSNLTQRTTLNFVGSSFTAADDAGNSRTNVTSDTDLDALASNTTNGLWARTGAGTGAARTITAGAGIAVTNGDGVAGSPSIATALETLVANQTIFDSASATRTITFGLSGATDPVLTVANNAFNISTGVLQQGGTAVVLQTRTLTAGNGLTGGGDLTADRTFDVGAGTGITVATDTVAINQAFTPTWTGAHAFSASVTFNAFTVSPPDVLTDAATIAVDASLGNRFRVTLGGNRTLGNPSNSTDGQQILFEVIQDGTGGRTLAFGTNYAFGTDLTSCTISTAANSRSFITAAYVSAVTKWVILGCTRGF